MVRLYSMIGRMRLVSDRPVIDVAVRVEDTLVETYVGPSRTLPEAMEYGHKGGMNFLTEFSEGRQKRPRRPRKRCPLTPPVRIPSRGYSS